MFIVVELLLTTVLLQASPGAEAATEPEPWSWVTEEAELRGQGQHPRHQWPALQATQYLVTQ